MERQRDCAIIIIKKIKYRLIMTDFSVTEGFAACRKELTSLLNVSGIAQSHGT